ncbi:uncharacterized protein LOC135171188 [Diachasmimorpha longicaudata]|uniref:uncharacterized protein LOC135171188 n=1 Tax=Diachasmimorpha longicaudata TaxID=58733 RepID=UPI0030B91AE9
MGKIPNAYRNLQAKLTKLEKGHTGRKPEASAVSTHEVSEQKQWMQENSEPWDSVVTIWDALYEERAAHALNAKNDINNFINEWPILKLNRGHELILRDFPAPELQLTREKWELFISGIQAVRPIKTRDQMVKNWIELLDHPNTNENSRTALQIHLLAQNVHPKKKINKNWKPSIPDCQDSILVSTQSVQTIDEAVEARGIIAKTRRTLVKPFILVIGSTIASVTHVYACLGGVKYEVPTVLQALDIVFKAFTLSKIDFPAESQTIWSLIKKAVYDISIEPDSIVAEICTNLDIHHAASVVAERSPDADA